MVRRLTFPTKTKRPAWRQSPRCPKPGTGSLNRHRCKFDHLLRLKVRWRWQSQARRACSRSISAGASESCRKHPTTASPVSLTLALNLDTGQRVRRSRWLNARKAAAVLPARVAGAARTTGAGWPGSRSTPRSGATRGMKKARTGSPSPFPSGPRVRRLPGASLRLLRSGRSCALSASARALCQPCHGRGWHNWLRVQVAGIAVWRWHGRHGPAGWQR